MSKYITLLALACVAAYGSAVYWPEFYFKNRREYGNFVIVSRSGVPPSAEKFVERASYRISKSELFRPGQKFEIYAADSPRQYAVFAPFCRGGYACIHPFKNMSFMAPADFERGVVASVKNPLKTASLENTMVHEAVKLQIRAMVRPLAYISMADWKKEGYGQYVAASDSDLQPSDICSPDAETNPDRSAYLYRLVMEYMLNEEKTSLQYILTTEVSPEAAIRTVKARYCGQ